VGRSTKGSRISQGGARGNLPRGAGGSPSKTPSKNKIDQASQGEERYRAFFAQSSEGIWRIELEKPIPTNLPVDEQIELAYRYGTLAECNDAMARQYGYDSAEALVGASLGDLLIKDDPDNVEFLRAFIVNGYRLNDAESHERDAEGNDRYFLNNFIGIVEDGFLKRAWGSQRDITGTKTEELDRARLAAIVESSDDAIISFDLDGNVTSWNVAASRIYGYTEPEALGQSMSLLIPEDRVDEETAILENIRAGKKVEHFETRRKTKSGQIIDVSLSVSPINDGRGKLIGISKITRDITGRKATERALNENRLMLAMAMQSSRMGVWERDIATGNVTWSEELEAIYGLKPGEFRGNEEHFYSLIHEDDRESTWSEVERAIIEKRAYNVEFRFYHSDGSVRWMEGRGEAVYSSSGEPIRMYGIGLDVTERKAANERLRQSEERFRLALSSGAVTVYEQDHDLRYKWLYPSDPYPSDYVGKTDEELAPGPEGLTLTNLKREVLASGRSKRAEVSAPVDGDRKWFDLLIEPRIDDSGNVVGIVGTALDITVRKRAEEQLKRQGILMDAALEPVIVWEFGGKIIDWNRGAERQYGYAAAEAIGNNSHDLLKTKFGTSAEEVEADLRANGSWFGELKHTTKSGDVITVESRHQLIEVDGRVLVLEANRDITERKRVSEELQRSEARLQAMFDSATVGIAVLDVDANFLQVNDAFCSITGYLRSELNTLDGFRIVYNEDLEAFTDGVVQLRSGEKHHFTIENRYVRKDGSIVWVQNSVSVTRDESGNPLHLIAISQDITAAKQAHIALQESEQRFSRFMQQFPGLAWIKDVSGRYVYANESAERSFGVKRDDLYGKTDDEVFPAEIAQSFKENDRLAVESGTGRQFLETMDEADGTHYSIVSKFPISDSRGQTALIGGMAIDVTEQKQAEGELKRQMEFDEAVMSSMAEGLFTIGLDGIVTSVNPAAENLLGWSSSELRGRNIHHTVHYKRQDGSEYPFDECTLINAVNAGNVLINEEDVYVKKYGSTFDIIYSASPIRSEGKITGGVVVFQDITERKTAEEQLERYRHLSEYASDIIWLLKDDGTILEVNQAAIDAYGFTREELIGKNVRELRHPSHLIELDAQLEAAQNGNIHFETVHQRKDGSALPVEVNASSAEFSGERLIMSILRDITERKRHERDNRFLLHLADLIRFEPDPRVLIARSTKLLGKHLDLGRCFFSTVDTSERTSTVIGEYMSAGLPPLEKTAKFDDYSSENLSAALAGQTIVVNDSQTDQRTANKYSVSYGREDIRSYVAVPQLRDSVWSGIIFAAKTEPHDWAESEVSLIQNVSERVWLAFEKLRSEAALRESERRAMEEYQRLLERIVPLAETLGAARDLETIYRSLQEFICASMECSAFFVSFYDSERHLRLPAFIWGDGEEIDVSELPPMEITAEGGPNSRAVLGKQTVITNNYYDEQRSRPHVVIRENGVDPMSSLVVPMVVQDRVIGTLEVQAYRNSAFEREHAIALEMAANLSAVAIENVRLIETEARARAEAETANRMKDEFLSVLSHELRTPLNAMLGWVRILRGGNVDPERMSKALEIIERNTRQQSSLIEDLLDVSRIISGKMRIETELIDLIPSLELATESVRPLANAKNVDFKIDVAREPLYLKGDAVRLQQVFTNLLQNAIKFTGAGGTVSLSWKREGPNVTVQVEDTGIGIESDFLPMIFDRFSQADASTRRNNTGLGLGLTIVHTIVGLHSGSTEAYSDGPGTGAIFKVSLPLAEEYYKHEISEPPPPMINGHSESLSGVRILVVDDDQDGLTPLRILLEKEKATVTCVLSASDALEELKRKDFDILISDIGMPSMDGFELISQIRSDRGNRNYGVRAIAYTAYASEDDKNRILSSGYEVHLAKPLDMEELLSIVRKFGSGIRQDLNGN
jgi:PAS domain S-box-containing protein